MTTWQDPAVLERWKAGAASREANLAGVTDALFAFARVRPGLRVLDCGCGSGEMTSRLADEVGEGGSVVAVDSSEGMLDLARATAGRPNVTFHRQDLHALDVPGEFDAAVARCVVMLLDDEVAGLRAVRSRLRPGARLACSVWTENNPRFMIPRQVFIELGHQPQPPNSLALVARLGDESRLAQALADAGFSGVHALRVRADARYPEPQTLVKDMLSNPATTQMLESIDEGERIRATELIAERARRLGTVIPAEQLVAAGAA